MAAPSSTQRYWASEEPARLAPAVMERWKEWHRYYRATGFARKAVNGALYLHGFDRLMESAAALALKGEKRQHLRMVMNEVRVLVQRNLAQMAARVPVMDPVAANGGSKARKQAMVARGVLEHFHRKERIPELHAQARKLAYTMGEAFRLCTWDAASGEVTAAELDETGASVPTSWAGEFKNEVLSPLEVARDVTLRSWRKARWVIAKTYENKWELAARFPEKASEILSISREMDPEDFYYENLGFMLQGHTGLLTGDFVPVYHFFHVDGPELPGGREFSCLSAGLWLGPPGPLPYSGLPLKRLSPDTPHGTTLGDTSVFDALGIADSLNILWSTWLTNNARWGIGALTIAQQTGLSLDQLGNGGPIFQYSPVPNAPDGGRPMPLQQPMSPPESFEVGNRLLQGMMRAVGQNETSMGQLPFAGMPASLVTQLIEQANQYQDAFLAEVTNFESETATHELEILKRFSPDPRVYEVMSPASRRWARKMFSGEDLKDVSQIAMEPVPAMAKSAAGKQMQLEAMQAMGVQLSPLQIVNFFKTGEIDSVLAEEQSTLLRQAAENELLQEAKYLTGPDGQPMPVMTVDPMTGLQVPMLSPEGRPVFQVDPEFLPPVVIGRPQWLDIPRHLALIGEDMENPAVQDAVLQTVMAKAKAWQDTPPWMLAMMGAPPFPTAPAPGMEAGALPVEGPPPTDAPMPEDGGGPIQ